MSGLFQARPFLVSTSFSECFFVECLLRANGLMTINGLMAVFTLVAFTINANTNIGSSTETSFKLPSPAATAHKQIIGNGTYVSVRTPRLVISM